MGHWLVYRQRSKIYLRDSMASKKCVIAGGVAVAAVAAGWAGVVFCRRDFAEAVASGDFDRAEWRAGLLAVNDIGPAGLFLGLLTLGALVLIVGALVLELVSPAHP